MLLSPVWRNDIALPTFRIVYNATHGSAFPFPQFIIR
jgi:hypothetical protein